MEIWTVRHGETEWSREAKHTGKSDVDLTAKGRSDLILYYPNTRGHRGEIVVLKNLGGW